jgi:hypothetical protein
VAKTHPNFPSDLLTLFTAAVCCNFALCALLSCRLCCRAHLFVSALLPVKTGCLFRMLPGCFKYIIAAKLLLCCCCSDFLSYQMPTASLLTAIRIPFAPAPSGSQQGELKKTELTSRASDKKDDPNPAILFGFDSYKVRSLCHGYHFYS